MQDLNDKISDGGATSAGLLTATEFNQIPSEVQNIIESMGLTLSGGDLLQAVKAISAYSTVGDFYIGGGSVNAYTATVGGSRSAPDALVDGMKIRLIINITNTAASTLNAFGSGVVSIKLAGGISDPTASDMVAGDEKEFIYRTSPSNHWELVEIDTAVNATQNQVDALVNADRYVSPLTLGNGSAILSATSGYVKLPSWQGNIVIQWGSGNVSSGGTTITFPLAFPTAVHIVVMSPISVNQSIDVSSLTTSNFVGTAPSPSAGYYVATGD